MWHCPRCWGGITDQNRWGACLQRASALMAYIQQCSLLLHRKAGGSPGWSQVERSGPEAPVAWIGAVHARYRGYYTKKGSARRYRRDAEVHLLSFLFGADMPFLITRAKDVHSPPRTSPGTTVKLSKRNLCTCC